MESNSFQVTYVLCSYIWPKHGQTLMILDTLHIGSTCVLASAKTGNGQYNIYVTGCKVKPKTTVKTPFTNKVVMKF